MDIDLICGYCGNSFSIYIGEYKRQIKKGRTVFYCGLSCVAKKRNSERPDKRILIEKLCLHCNSPFFTLTGSKSTNFCSRSCASAGSVTDKRRNARKNNVSIKYRIKNIDLKSNNKVSVKHRVKNIDLICGYCGNSFSIYYGEYNRQIKNGRTVFYCGLSCAAKKRNAGRSDRRILVEKLCLYCKSPFFTMTGSKSASFCSRYCASAGSVTEDRRNAQKRAGLKHKNNLISVDDTLRKREMWKYKKLKLFLESIDENFQFEFKVGDYVFDLALIDRMIFVEFDGIDHSYKKQLLIDIEKDKFVENDGWRVIRKDVQTNTIIEPDLLYDILK